MKKFKPYREYTEEKEAEIYKKYGVFWAFSERQFNESKKESEKYVSFWGNCFAPVQNLENFKKELNEMHEKMRSIFLTENSSKNIILNELYNHECFYTGDILPAFEVLSIYGFNIFQVREIYINEMKEKNL